MANRSHCCSKYSLHVAKEKLLKLLLTPGDKDSGR
jgi:hypothetical protein